MSENEVSLEVLDAYTRDGIGVARLDLDSMYVINVRSGYDIIEIEGKLRTVARCQSLYPSDEGKGIIRMNASVRQNAGVEIGDVVSIRRAHAVQDSPKQIVITPVGHSQYVDESYLGSVLENTPLMKGDILSLPTYEVSVGNCYRDFKVVSIDSTTDVAVVTCNTAFTIAEIPDSESIEGKTISECKCPSCETDVNLLDGHCHKCGHKLDVIDITSKLLQEWILAVVKNDPKQIADLYRDDGLVLGFDDNYEEGIGHGDIISKFDDIKHGSGGSTRLITILSQNPRVFGSVAINSGQCRWHLEDSHTDEWFSFVYNKDDDGVWKIVSHHRSLRVL